MRDTTGVGGMVDASAQSSAGGGGSGCGGSIGPRCTAAKPDACAVTLVYFVVRQGYVGDDEQGEVAQVCRQWRDVIDAVRSARRSALYTSAVCARHHIPRRSERPERLQLVLERCQRRYPRIKCVDTLSGASVAQLMRFHTEIHVDTITRLSNKIQRSMQALEGMHHACTCHKVNADACMHHQTLTRRGSKGNSVMTKRSYYEQFEFIDIDSDTVMMRHTFQASVTAAGAVCHAIDHVLQGRTQNAFCVVRPPGHHAEPQRAMGFCFFNNVGVGAFHALDRHQLKRVAIIDFDVHHGNGTQKRVEAEPGLLYVSLHQVPLFPGTGFAHECGRHNNIVNVPLPPRTTSRMYRKLFLTKVVERVNTFQPELILISAGFDAHVLDPLAQVRLEADDYYWLTTQIVDLAWRHCHGRVVSVLEGGYHARALAESADQHVRALVHGSLDCRHVSRSLV